MRTWLTLAAAAALSASAYAANPFSDVPRTHWAYKAISRAVDAGVLEGYDGKFHGEKLINRYQMAVIVKRVLDNVGRAGGASAAGMSGDDVKNLEAMMIEFADELAMLNVKVSSLEDSFVEMRGEVDRMKMGMGTTSMRSSGGLANAFTGFVSVGLISTDDGTCVGCAANSPGALTRYTGTTADQTFFAIPQASIALDTEVSDGIGLHVQYDYGTTATDGGRTVGLNEAYLFVDEIFGDIGGKVGGFALPFQSWEINGPFRTLNYTITPSAKNTLLEAARVIGLEFTKTKDVDPADVRWSFSVFNGQDIAANAGAGTVALAGVAGVGAMTDAAGLRALGGSNTFDDSFGFAIDIESGDDPEKDWGWRIGYMDLGGDNQALPTVAPAGGNPAGLANSMEISGFQLGFWWKNEDFRVQFEWMDAENEFASGANNSLDANSWYFLVNYAMDDKNSLTLRYDDWENELNVVGGGGDEGDAFTFAFNRRISDTSMFQFEYLTPDTDLINAGAGVTATDTDDDLVQFRYKVWF
jgi:hypothetical protein